MSVGKYPDRPVGMPDAMTFDPGSTAGERLMAIRRRRAAIMLEQNGDAAFALTTNADVVVLMGLEVLRSGRSGADVARLLAEYVAAQERRDA